MKWPRRFRRRRDDGEPVERVDWRGLLFSLVLLAGVGFAYAYPRLVVETNEGHRFTVAVGDEQYEQARVGMWLSRRDSELRLSSSEPGRGTDDGDGTRFKAR